MSCFRPYINEPLPDQDEYCREPGAMCGYVEKSLPRSRWDKRLAIISAQGELIIYKYYLLDLCPGEPLMGKIYELKKIKNMRLERLVNGKIIIQIYLSDGKKVKLRLSGENASAWAAKLINIRGESLGHQTHPTIDYTSLQSKVPRRSETVVRSPPQAKILGIHRASPSISNNSKFSYSVTLEGDESNEDYGITRNGGEDVLLSGDFPSIIDGAKFDGTGRARGGKVQEDVSEMIHTIMTTSSHTSSNRKLIRQQVDELIKKHMQENGKRPEDNSYSPEKIRALLNLDG